MAQGKICNTQVLLANLAVTCKLKRLNSFSGYQTDFSVTNRLLTPYNGSPSSMPAHHVPSATISYRNGESSYQPQSYISSMPGWQNLLPNDQGGLSRSYQQSGWRGAAVPNINIATATPGSGYLAAAGYSGSGAGATGSGGQSSSCHPTQSPDSSTGGSMSFKDKENPGSTSSLSNGDKCGKFDC